MITPKSQYLFIYDLDDTLFANHHFFSELKEEYGTLVVGSDEAQLKAFLTFFEKINLANIPKMGYTPLRFGTSMRQAYEEWQQLHRQPVDDALGERVFRMGLSVANPQKVIDQGLYPGIIDALELHKARGDHMILLTKGHEPTQRMKIDVLHLAPYFDEIVIVPDTKNHVFERFAHHPKKFTIGNSVKSDIIPALPYGFVGVHVNTITWEFEKVNEPPQNLINIDSPEKLPAWIRSL